MLINPATLMGTARRLRPSLSLNFLGTTSLDSQLTFTRASTAWAYNSSGVLTSRAIDAPRFDYDPVTLQPKGLLIEEARTNLAIQSAALDDAAYTKTASTITANAATSPDGTVSADKLAEDATTGFHRSEQFPTLADSTAYVWSVHVKAAERSWCYLEARTKANAFPGAFFNLSLGVVGTQNNGGVGTITSVGNGWYRCTLAWNTGTGATAPYIGVQTATADVMRNYAGTAGNGIYVWGAQLEAGAFATSYVPTTTVAVTRAADLCTMPIGSWYSATEGTLFAEFTPEGVSGLQTVAYFDDTTSNERMGIRSTSGTNAMVAIDGGVTQVQATLGTIVAGTGYKAAMAYRTDDFAGSQNGGTVATDVVGTLPTVTRMLIGSRLSGSDPFSGHVRRLTYYNRRLSDAVIQGLTV